MENVDILDIWDDIPLERVTAEIYNIIADISDAIGYAITITQDTICTCENGICLRSQDGTIIWEIFEWKFCVGDEEFEHIWIEISEQFRRRGVATQLYKIWEELWYRLPENEYTRDINKIDFFQTIGYTPVSVIHDETWEEEEIYGSVFDYEIWDGYSCKLVLES